MTKPTVEERTYTTYGTPDGMFWADGSSTVTYDGLDKLNTPVSRPSRLLNSYLDGTNTCGDNK